ncbi:uncharacterized protein YdaL [Tumebacillus permanentifrigoris]|uniref:Uncharacterized protein YdaL n=2 Tax=Tumebacillus permanentifrigoris TaxID=378543 RepID=A0A316DIU4_9BACL|nr:uncharacterized protein YdaL [Tumebacillus permanentifrigoris]
MLAVLVYLYLSLQCPAVHAQDQSRPGLLLMYHTGYENEQVFMRAAFNLLATFGVEITPVNLEEQAPGEASLREAVEHAQYMVCLQDRQGTASLPDRWARVIRTSSAAVYFMGDDPGAVVSGLPFTAVKVLPSATKLVIRGENYPLDVALDVREIQVQVRRSGTLQARHVTDPLPVQVWSEVSNGSRTSPFVVSTRSAAGRVVFACGRYVAFGELSYAIADSLFEFFCVKVQPRQDAYIRIEDVHPMRDPEEIRKITAFLSGEQIPFLIGVIPIYQSGGEQVKLTDRPELVRALQEAQEKGATLILHGCTHQYYDTETGEGYEFWDSVNKGPIPDEEQYVQDKLQRGLHILLENKLYPAAFEPPHYAMTRHGYEVAAKYFSTVVGNLQLTDTSFITMEPPYPIHHSFQGGMTFYPENGGYVYDEQAMVVPEMLANMKKVQIVRRSQTGAFFHSYLPLADLQRLVKGMQAMKLTFFNLRNVENTVTTPWGTITTREGQLHADLQTLQADTLPAPAAPSRAQKLSNFVAWGVVSVVTTVIAVFLVQVRLLRRRRRSRLFEERPEGGESQ